MIEMVEHNDDFVFFQYKGKSFQINDKIASDMYRNSRRKYTMIWVQKRDSTVMDVICFEKYIQDINGFEVLESMVKNIFPQSWQ